MASNNSGGEKNLNYGKTERYVEELHIVLRDGNEYSFKNLKSGRARRKKEIKNLEGDIYRKVHELIEQNYEKIMAAKPDVSKNSAGYYLWNVLDKAKGIFDINKLLVGSQGTLGL
jgi:FAD/FMN-containing dehydrogenase